MLWKGSSKNASEAERTTFVQKPACASPGRVSHDITSQPASQHAGEDPDVSCKGPAPRHAGGVLQPRDSLAPGKLSGTRCFVPTAPGTSPAPQIPARGCSHVYRGAFLPKRY